MKHLDRLGNHFSISVPVDQDGMTARECPNDDCDGYFKIQLGTGLTGKDLPCYCAYCGHCAPHNKFFTKEQIEYAKSVVLNKVTGAILKDLKELEFEHKPKGVLGMGISMKVQGRPHPIRYYREKELETDVTCDHCTLHYMIYGIFGYCPDCGVHNSLQILIKNLELIEKVLGFAEAQEPAVAGNLVANALEDCVSSFDGFARETCRIFSNKSSEPTKSLSLSFQNIRRARERLLVLFGFDLIAPLSAEESRTLERAFQKRHLFAHRMGVIDHDFVNTTKDVSAIVGRKVQINGSEILEVADSLKLIGQYLFESLLNK